jgi:hypothetical protein
MRLAVFAVLAVLVVISAPDAEPDHHQIGSLMTTCDNDGRCNTFKENVDTDVAHKSHYRPMLTEAGKDGPRAAAIDANGNTAGLVISHKTGARARVGVAYAARFQAYIDDLENNHGARVLFIGGVRPGRCRPESQHPCGKALDVCQVSRGRVDPRCNLPGRAMLAQIASAHGLFEGGRWCQSDYGHVQIGVTAPACGDGPFRVVRQVTPDLVTGESHP